MKENQSLTYKGSGVDYSTMDPFKLLCQRAGFETAKAFLDSDNYLRNIPIQEIETSRGESVYLQKLYITSEDYYIAHVHEGLGTKNLVADAMNKLTNKTFYDAIGQDTVAMIVNDMITLGALPSSIAMHLSVGNSNWFDDTRKIRDLVKGWKDACISAGAIWSCGETPTLKDILLPEAAELSGSALGVITNKKRLFKSSNIEPGDAIIFIESSGIHANGLTLARQIADRLPDGYLTRLSNGETYGKTLLEPTIIYVPFIKSWLERGANIHYAVNITGHGWRKLMRAPQSFNYVINRLPWQNIIFDFIQEKGNITNEEMYGNYNMGAGFAVFTSKETAKKIVQFEQSFHSMYFEEYHQEPVFVAGYVEESNSKKVTILPKGITFESDTLSIR